MEAEERERRLIQCPECGFSTTVFKDEPLPDEGPVCAMGHEPMLMLTAIIPQVNRG